MSDRKKIENFCKQNKFEILRLEYSRGGPIGMSFWEIDIKNGDEIYSNDSGQPDGIDGLINDIKEDLLQDNH